VAVVGIVIAFIGSLVTAGGSYFSGTTRYGLIAGQQSAAAEPIIGVVVLFVGIVLIAIGVIAAVLCAVIYLSARSSRRKQP
jgi:heme/copper-type cytochrome/quinol oxidase subunit 2